MGSFMAAALKPEESFSDEIDMERVVSDAEYRRQVISRLRRERRSAQTLLSDDADLVGEED
jgi:hypothetical protein